MRSRRTRVPPPGFALALPPPHISDEMQVQQKNELFINMDLSITSPDIILNEPLFPGRFFHVNNTNLFVLIDGVSMFTEGKTVQKENVPAPLLEEEVEVSRMTTISPKKPPRYSSSSAVDSVEAAIRGIENVSNGSSSAPLKSSAASPAAPTRRHSLTQRTGVNTTVFIDTVEEKTSGSSTTLVELPREYVALFKSKNMFSSSTNKQLSNNHNNDNIFFGKVRGFLPITVGIERRVDPTSSTHKRSKPTISPLIRDDSTSSLTLSAVSEIVPQVSTNKREDCKYPKIGKKARNKTFSVDDIGLSNRSFDLESVVKLDFIGNGSQGTVHRVTLDGKLYALKTIDVKEVIEATSDVERQGRKRGLVQELNMISLQRSREVPKHLMRVFNAVTDVCNGRQKLYLLMELMSFSVEDAQKMVSRFPVNEMKKMTQSTFRSYLAGSASVQRQTEKLLKQQSASCMHLTGRSSYNNPEDWEMSIDRQTPLPEIILSMLAADVLKGLKELHEDYHIIHCDLKPANILLNFNKTCFKIADFGCGCQIDSGTQWTSGKRIDLGSKLYKAPERLRNELECAETEEDMLMVEFTPAADVWSLGIMLLELGNGVHPCYSFKSDYWNYVNNLKLSRMVKPLAWSAEFHDFIVRCLMREYRQRWTVNRLLDHPFIQRYSAVPREKLKAFMERIKNESETFQRRQQRELLEKQILLSTGKKAHDRYQNQSRASWKKFTGFLSVAPQFHDTEKFPRLS